MHCKVLIWPEKKERETAAECRMQQQKQNCTNEKKKNRKKQVEKHNTGEKEVQSADGRSTNLGSALVVLFQLTRKRCERARLKQQQQQETGSKNRQQTGFTPSHECTHTHTYT